MAGLEWLGLLNGVGLLLVSSLSDLSGSARLRWRDG